MVSAYQFAEVYEDLGLDLTQLGCLMLGTETPDTSFIADEDLYVSPDPKKFWVDGRVSKSHVTLRYGFLPNVRARHVDAILDGMELPEAVEEYQLTCFPSPYPDENYECIVAELYTDDLGEINARLGMLPNINTFPEYRPHVTLAYVRPGWYHDNVSGPGAIDRTALRLKTTELDYGHILSRS